VDPARTFSTYALALIGLAALGAYRLALRADSRRP
jgi:hypothetical protein